MLVRQMWKDPRLKKICDIEVAEPPYGIAVLSRFRSKVGPERLSKIMYQTVEVLVKKGRIKGMHAWVSTESTVSPSVGQWYSVELHWKSDAVNGLGELYVNGQLVCSISGVNACMH